MAEISLFYEACIGRRQQDLLDAATAARVAQSDAKGWTSFVESINKNLKSLVSPRKSDTAKPAKKQDAASVRGFASLLGKTIKQKVIRNPHGSNP
jgi:hypothetical protein